MNNKEELMLWIKLSQTENIGPKGFAKIITFLRQENKDIGDLSSMNIKDLGFLLAKNKISSVDPSKVLRTKTENIGKLLNSLEEREIKVLTLKDSDYPNSLKIFLRETAPPVLYAFGNLALLDKKSLGIVGCRHPSEKSINIAKSVAEKLTQKNICIVSGYAAGIDAAAHWGALKNNGTTIIILPYGILNFKWKEPFNDLDGLSERALVLSQFYPNTRWNIWSAMQRNKIVVGLSNGIFAVEFKEDGGTFDTIKTAAKLKKPVFVLDDDENRKVLKRNNISAIYFDANSKNLESFILDKIQKNSFAIDKQLSFF